MSGTAWRLPKFLALVAQKIEFSQALGGYRPPPPPHPGPVAYVHHKFCLSICYVKNKNKEELCGHVISYGQMSKYVIKWLKNSFATKILKYPS